MWIWMWKHRYVWKKLKQLWDNRAVLRSIVSRLDRAGDLPMDGDTAIKLLRVLHEQAAPHHEWLRDLDRLSCAVPTRPVLRRKNRPMMRRSELPEPVQGETNPILDKAGNLKDGLIRFHSINAWYEDKIEQAMAVRNPLKEIWGKWPGDESIDEILDTLKGTPQFPPKRQYRDRVHKAAFNRG